jgi:methyl-accepting chemotaxis protein
MKIKFKLGICAITIMAVSIIVINILLLKKACGASYNLSIRSLEHLAGSQAEFWQGRQDGYFRTLHTLANVMGDYESINELQRRDRFDDMLKSALESEPQIITLYTVWKPNSIDGMDAHFIDRTGSSPVGQYAIAYSKQKSGTVGKTSSDIDNVMAHIGGINAHKDYVENPAAQRANGKDMLTIKMMVPIINHRTGEAVGGLGCFLVIDNLQQTAEKTIKTNDEIALMALYSDNGTILAHSNPGMTGRLMFDAGMESDASEKMIYQTIQNGKYYENALYDPQLKEKIIYVIKPFPIGDSDHNWSILIGASESHILSDVRALARFSAVLTVMAILAAAVIFLVILRFITKPVIKVASVLRNNSEGEKKLNRISPEKRNEKITGMSHYSNKYTGKAKRRLSGIPIHTGGITMFPMTTKLTPRLRSY